MNHRFTYLALLFAILSLGNFALACNLSVAGPTFIVTPIAGTPDTMITFDVCIGGGVTGTTNGADGDTRTFSFGWYSTNSSFSVLSFSPSSVTGIFTGCTMPGSIVGPLGSFGTQDNVFYFDPGY